ncbi:hypothetical protein BS47DRAFT_1366391 [Hydnum rufescens UP504]|uniref:Uncharacterized protein n=1 Tax=Hydnum rufescens UP504 TaxID=1448309 RepID=A0A9P6DRQ4_9AGAM|nr:hypothetical protein BS47DRAFT_1366391 [Hydnum rufescens UP504]
MAQKGAAKAAPFCVTPQMKTCEAPPKGQHPVNDEPPNNRRTNHTPQCRSSFPQTSTCPKPPQPPENCTENRQSKVRDPGQQRVPHPANAGVWIEFEAPETKTTDSRDPQTTRTTVNRQAKPAQMATDEPGEPPSKPQGSNAQYHMPPSAGVWYKSGAKRAAIAALFALL